MATRKKVAKAADKPWITAKGIKLLRRVKRHILAHPKTYRQDKWHCGTAMCIAGHAAMMSGLVVGVKKVEMLTGEKVIAPVQRGDTTPSPSYLWRYFGAKALDAHVGHIYALFARPADWPLPYATDYGAASSYKARAEVAAQRIEYFIRTGK